LDDPIALGALAAWVISGSGLPAFKALNMAMCDIITMPPFSAPEIRNSIAIFANARSASAGGSARIAPNVLEDNSARQENCLFLSCKLENLLVENPRHHFWTSLARGH
jgi:hypothetical protein